MAERETLQLQRKTVSLWSFVNSPDVIQSFMNPLYEPNATVIWPSVAPPSVVSNLFLVPSLNGNKECFSEFCLRFFGQDFISGG